MEYLQQHVVLFYVLGVVSTATNSLLLILREKEGPLVNGIALTLMIPCAILWPFLMAITPFISCYRIATYSKTPN